MEPMMPCIPSNGNMLELLGFFVFAGGGLGLIVNLNQQPF